MSNDKGNVNSEGKEFLEELETIMSDAESKVYDDVVASVLEDFKKIEEKLWDEYGDPDNVATIWSVVLRASGEEESQKYLDSEEANAINILPEGETIAGVLGIEPVAEGGNIYEMLSDPKIIFGLAKDDSVGMIVRIGGWATEEKGVRPSQSKERKNMALTMLCTNNAFMSISRVVENPDKEPIINAERMDKIKMGEQRLVDAMILARSMPIAIKEDMPDVYSALMKDIYDKN